MSEKEFIELVPRLRLVALESGRRAGAGADEAEDIAQETIIRLWQMSDRLGTLASPEAFTATVARHLAIGAFRKNRRFAGGVEVAAASSRGGRVGGEAGSLVPEAARVDGPDVAMETKEDEAWLERRLRELPSTEYAILHMRQVERLDNSEMARRLGIRETSVATLLSRARRRLLEEIRKRK